MIIENQQDVTKAVLSELQRAPDAQVQGDHVRLRAPPARLRARGEADRGGVSRRHRLCHRARQAQQRVPQRGGADVGLARPVVADLPAQQRRQRNDGNRPEPARTVLADALAGHAEWRLDRALAHARAGACSSTPGSSDAKGNPIVGAEVDIWHSSPEGYYENQDPVQADMNLRGKFITDADGHISFPQREARGLSDPDRRADRRSPARAGPPQHAAGASAFPRQQGRLQDADLAALCPRRSNSSRPTCSSASPAI